ncbi:MAG TPA: hypothetical protein VFP30_08615 [Candidatus Limnocylindria bacterium]|nr:hypothetical protein [Candidatus Limnocylindria bacterium]
MPEVAVPEILILLLTAILPISAGLFALYVVVRLAIRHERRDRSDR